MSRNTPRRTEPGIKIETPAALTPQPAELAPPAETPPEQDRGWAVVQWLWPLCFGVLLLAEVGLFLFRKFTN